MLSGIMINIWLGFVGNNSIVSFGTFQPFEEETCEKWTTYVTITVVTHNQLFQLFMFVSTWKIFDGLPRNSIRSKMSFILHTVSLLGLPTRTLLVPLLIIFDVVEMRGAVKTLNETSDTMHCDVFENLGRVRIKGVNLAMSTIICSILFQRLYDFGKQHSNNKIFGIVKRYLRLFVFCLLLVEIFSNILTAFNVILSPIALFCNIFTVWFGLNVLQKFQKNKYESVESNDSLSMPLVEESKVSDECISISTSGDSHMAMNVDRNTKFDLSDKYIENARILQDCLLQIFERQNQGIYVFAQLIAEYAATVHLNCIMCDRVFPCIECYEDYGDLNGAMALFDVNGQPLFYLNTEPDRWSLCERNDTADVDMEIFCVDCGKQWRCTVCSFQALQFSYDSLMVQGGCATCKQNVCDDCVICHQDEYYCERCCDVPEEEETKSENSAVNYADHDWTEWNFDAAAFE